MVLKFGLSSRKMAGRNRIVINSDNLEVIDATKNGGRSVGAVTIFDDCYYIVCDFSISKFDHCNREANKVVHELAILARFSLTSDWFEKPVFS